MLDGAIAEAAAALQGAGGALLQPLHEKVTGRRHKPSQH
jgi:hypothetical protein